MTFGFIITASLTKQVGKLAHKDKVLAIAVRKKITQIINSNAIFVNHFKNLGGNLKGYKRVHVGSFVLMFKIEGNMLIFDRFRHHDKAYKR